MAVVPMTKVGIIGYAPESARIMDAIRREGVVHITPMSTETAEKSYEIENLVRRVDSAAEFIIRFLEQPPKKPTLSPEQALDIVKNFDYEPFLAEVEKLKSRYDQLASSVSRWEGLINILAPWESLPAPLGLMHDTKHCRIRMGIIPAQFTETFEHEVIEQPLLYWYEVSRAYEGMYVVVVYHNSIAEWMEGLLAKVEFTHWAPKQFTKTAAEEIAALREKISAARKEMDSIAEKVRSFADKLISLWVLGDHFEQLLEEYRLLDSADRTERTFAFQGWVPKKQFPKLKRRLETAFDTIEVMELPILPEDEPPVALKNPFFIEAFEVITDLYGRPRKGMVDPTPFVAPFFAIYFGLCLTDAGYGLLLTLGAIVGLSKFRQPGTRKFLRLILYVGISTIIAGIITGGYFGIKLPPPEGATGLAALALRLKLFDPLDDIMEFFAISVAFGVVQLSIGFLLAMYVNLKESKKITQYLHAVVVGLAWIAVTVGVGMFVIGYILPETLGHFMALGKNVLAAGVVGILFGHLILGPIAGKGIGTSIANAFGFDGLYGIIGVFSDLLSFVRITALGLSTAIVAGVITQMSLQMKGVLLVFGILLLVVGHIFYCLFSSLGAFVHPTRLQFVEFFSRFYESGGKPFEPFRRKYRRVEVI